MAKKTRKKHPNQIGEWWPTIRTDIKTPSWYLFSYNPQNRRTIKTATGVVAEPPFDQNAVPAKVMDLLIEKYKQAQKHKNKARDAVLVWDLLADYWQESGVQKPGGERIYYSLRHFNRFLEQQEKPRFGHAPLLSDIDHEMIMRFQEWRKQPHSYAYTTDAGEERHFHSKGVSDNSINTDLDYVRAALTWNFKKYRIESAPFIPKIDNPIATQSRHRVLTTGEYAQILESAWDLFESVPQVMITCMILTFTGARPDCLGDLHTDWCFAREGQILITNHPDRPQTKKYRLAMYLHPTLAAWLLPLSGHLVSYRRHHNISLKETVAYGLKPCGDIKKAWGQLRAATGMPWLQRETLRHTIATWLDEYGLYESHLDLFQSHRGSSSRSTSRRHYSHLRPEYIEPISKALDSITQKLLQHTNVHLRPRFDPDHKWTKFLGSLHKQKINNEINVLRI